MLYTCVYIWLTSRAVLIKLGLSDYHPTGSVYIWLTPRAILIEFGLSFRLTSCSIHVCIFG